MSKGEEPQINSELLIKDSDDQAPMKIINPSPFPNFHVLASEYPDTFIFEFEVVYRTYDYLSDVKKLKIFPSTLKDATLRWV